MIHFCINTKRFKSIMYLVSTPRDLRASTPREKIIIKINTNKNIRKN